MRNFQAYQKYQATICEWYDRIVENHELLKADVEALQEAKSNLQEGRFVVAVCGEMNSGKSTLLNALLFSEEVLPSHITTMTAKIALMEGSEADRVEATLYTRDEFNQVKQASKMNAPRRNWLRRGKLLVRKGSRNPTCSPTRRASFPRTVSISCASLRRYVAAVAYTARMSTLCDYGRIVRGCIR